METSAVKQNQCPRCGQTFQCQPEDIMHCQCYGVVLSAAALEFIGLQFKDCLCHTCLTEIGAQFPEGMGEKVG